jgi:hypothetical protein
VFEDPLGYSVASLLVPTGDGDLGAFVGKQDGSSFTDAGGASRDESNFVLQAH